MTAPLNADKLGKLLALASSDNDAEALSALRMARSHLTAAGMDFVGLAQSFGKLAEPRFDYAAPRPQPKPQGYKVGNFTWPNKAAYERFCADQKARRQADWESTAPERADAIARHGSEEAALVRNAMEQAMHDAVASWLKPYQPDTIPPGRWHRSVDGWERHGFDEPPQHIREAIERALPLPATLTAALVEFDAWERRDRELGALLGTPGDNQLDIPADIRRDLIRRLVERTLPAADLAELLARSRYYRALEMHDNAIEAAMHRDLERLVADLSNLDTPDAGSSPVQSGHLARASERRARVLALLSNLDTAAWSDRAIAQAAGVSPSTVGKLRREASR